MILLKGKPVSDAIRESVTERIRSMDRAPRLAIVRVGDSPEDMAYERSAAKKLSGMGIEVSVYAFLQDISSDDFMSEFSSINEDSSVDGILVLRPLPKHLKDAGKWLELNIDPKKDVDCIGPVNLSGVMSGDGSVFAPCTAQAVIEILKGHGISLKGKRVTVIGRSMVVGRPLAMLLLKEDATVTICHTKTEDLEGACRSADIIIAAAGHEKLVDSRFVRDGQIIVDVGTNVDEQGNLTGDVNISEIEAAGISLSATPVPGGVGVVTTAVLADHVCKARMKAI